MSSNIKEAYGSSSAITITLASLASDSSLLAGRESTVVVNTTNLYRDYQLGGKIMTGTSPTAGTFIYVYAYGSFEDTPLYPDAFTGTDNNRSLTSSNTATGSIVLLKTIVIDSTSSRAYSLGPISIRAAFGNVIPKNFGIWVVHNTGVVLNATGGNHFIYATPVYQTVG